MPEFWFRRTPGLDRLTRAFIGQRPTTWSERVTCSACDGKARGYRNAAGEFAPPDALLPLAGYEWWYCETCKAHGHHSHPSVPLHLPAGLLVAKQRLAEVSSAWMLTVGADGTPEEVAATLRDLDPEMRG